MGEENRIFGTVTPQQVSEKLAEQGFTIDRKYVRLNEDIRLIGVYAATVKAHAEVEAQVKVRVVPEGGEAAPAAEAAPTAEEVPAEAAPAAEAAAEAAPAAEETPPAETEPATEAEAAVETRDSEE